MTFLTVVILLSGKSVTYLATRPEFRASIMSSSLTRPPRARFSTRTWPFILEMASALIKSLVSLL